MGTLPKWHFFACGKESHDEFIKLDPDFDRAGWHEITFPHPFDSIQSQDNVFGWYVCVLQVPESLTGHDLVLDLGVIDDADITYFNGKEVGRTGSFTDNLASAWNLDRRYQVPSAAVRYGAQNVISVQVKDFGGIGGLLGQPTVGAVVKAEDGSWRFRTDEGEASWATAGFDDAVWSKVGLPDLDFRKRVPDLEGYAWYRLRFQTPEACRDKAWVLDLGPVYDACEVYLNGKRIGQAGQMPPEFIPATGARGRVLVQNGALQESNVLAVRVHHARSKVPENVDPLPAYARTRDQGGAGLPGYPAIDFTTHASVASARALSASAVLDLAELCLNSNAEETASALLNELVHRGLKGSDAERWLDLQIQVACLSKDASAAKLLLCRFVTEHPKASPSLTTMYRLHYLLAESEPLDQGVVYQGQDRETSGDRRPLYGNYGYILCGWNMRWDLTCIIWPGKPYSRKSLISDN